jgi:hypothetical protein
LDLGAGNLLDHLDRHVGRTLCERQDIFVVCLLWYLSVPEQTNNTRKYPHRSNKSPLRRNVASAETPMPQRYSVSEQTNGTYEYRESATRRVALLDIADIADRLKKRVEKSDDKTVATVRREMESTAEIPRIEQRHRSNKS